MWYIHRVKYNTVFKKELNLPICYNMDYLGGHYAKCNSENCSVVSNSL